MTTDDLELTPEEEKAAVLVRGALRRMSADKPVGLDLAAWTAPSMRHTSIRSRLAPSFGLLSLATVLLLAAILAAGTLFIAGSMGSQSRHFDNGQFSFDYPASWQTLSSEPGTIVLGTGHWCSGMPSSGCASETIDISGGAIVFSVWMASGDAAPAYCASGQVGSASLIEKYTEDSLHANQPTTRWQIRQPGYDFGMAGDVWIEAVTGSATELANAQKAVDSFHWERDYCSSPSAPATLQGTAGHFDDGSFSFDYPTSWPVISGGFSEGLAAHVTAVIGTGSWHSGCRITDNGGSCTGDTVDVSGGRVVVKIWERVDGPAPMCVDETPPNATLGSNSVLRSTDANSTTWEIRRPGASFGWLNNVFVQAWTGSDDALTEVETLIASFRWDAGTQSAENVCPSASPSPPPLPTSSPLAHYQSDGISFDHPAGWRVLSSYQHAGIHGPTLEFAVGTGSIDIGCTAIPADSTTAGGVNCAAGPTVHTTGNQVVVFWYEGPHLFNAGPLPSSLPPGGAMTTIGGQPAIQTSGAGWIKWQVSRIGYIEAEWGPGATDAGAQLNALLATMEIPASQ